MKKIILITLFAFGTISAMQQTNLEPFKDRDMLLSREEADFIYLASHNDLKRVKELSELVDINVKNKKGSTALHWASFRGYFDIVFFLLSRNAKVDIRDKQRKTPLQWACGNGNTAIAQILLNCKADPDLTDEKGDTALHWSIFNFHNDCAKKLIEFNAEINCQNNEGITPLNTALIVGNEEMTNFLLQKKAELLSDKLKRNPVHCAVWGNNVNCLTYILKALSQKEKNDFINGRDFDGETPMHYAATSVNWKIALELIKHGSDVNLQCYHKQRTPLHIVLRNLKGTKIHAESIDEYMKKQNNRFDINQALDFIEALKTSNKLDVATKDYAGMSLFDCIEHIHFDNSSEKSALINILFNLKK